MPGVLVKIAISVVILIYCNQAPRLGGGGEARLEAGRAAVVAAGPTAPAAWTA